jgi:simple sugar transport system permease protein
VFWHPISAIPATSAANVYLCGYPAFKKILGNAFSDLNNFTRYISAGRGFIALAIVAFSGWNPIAAIAGSMIFGFFDALSLYLPVKIQLIYPRMNLTSTSYVFRTVPYIAVLITVSVAFRKGRMPRDLGKPYIKE